jgi:hypothetical protein
VPAIRFLGSVLTTARNYFLYSDISYACVDFIYILIDIVASLLVNLAVHHHVSMVVIPSNHHLELKP